MCAAKKRVIRADEVDAWLFFLLDEEKNPRGAREKKRQRDVVEWNATAF